MTEHDQPDIPVPDNLTRAEIAAEALSLSTTPERLGLIIDAEHNERRTQVTEWLRAHAESAAAAHWLNEQQRKAGDDETPLNADQLEQIAAWGPYVDLVMPRIDAIPGMVERERALLGMYIDQALVYDDAGLSDVYLDRMTGLTGYAILMGLIDEVPQLRKVAARTGQPVD